AFPRSWPQVVAPACSLGLSIPLCPRPSTHEFGRKAPSHRLICVHSPHGLHPQALIPPPPPENRRSPLLSVRPFRHPLLIFPQAPRSAAARKRQASCARPARGQSSLPRRA